MKKLKLFWGCIAMLLLVLPACEGYGDYGDKDYRIKEYVFADDEGTTNCLMQYTGEKLSLLTYFFSDGGEFVDDGYVNISYEGSKIIMEDYYPQDGEFIREIIRTLTVANGRITSFEYEDMYDFNAHEKFEMTYQGDKVDRIDYYAVANDGYRKLAYYQWEYNGSLWNMEGYAINPVGEAFHFYESAFESKNGQLISRYESYRNSGETGFTIAGGEEREYNEFGVSKIRWIDFHNGAFLTTATTDFQYSEQGLIEYERYVENDGFEYNYEIDYEEGLGNYSLFNFMLYDYFFKIYWEYPLFKSGKNSKADRYFRGTNRSLNFPH